MYITQHKEAEIGPLIPFWCESTFAAEKLLSFSGFNQKKQTNKQKIPFLPPQKQKGRVDANKEGKKLVFILWPQQLENL